MHFFIAPSPFPPWLAGNYMAPVSLIAVEIKISLNTTAANVAQHNTIEKFHLNFVLTKLTIWIQSLNFTLEIEM